MRRAPRPATGSILSGGLWQHVLWVGILMAAVVLSIQAGARAAGWSWRTMVFTTIAFLQLGHALAVRSERRSFFSLGVRSVAPPPLNAAGRPVSRAPSGSLVSSP